jgi:hypothetical protein
MNVYTVYGLSVLSPQPMLTGFFHEKLRLLSRKIEIMVYGNTQHLDEREKYRKEKKN